MISRYRVLEQIGSGGMSVVYRGLDTALDREVAIKVLHPHLATKEESRRRFSREAKAVASLHHPNILEIFDFSGDQAPESFIVTEYIRGATLRVFAEKHRFSPPEIAAMALHELSAALEHAHSAGVIHRDLKPENVMIRDDGVIKLMDFGIAKFLEREERMTMTGALVGSPAHMAPEIIEGLEAGCEADVFSLGTILYWLICGKLPFLGNNTTQTLKLILDASFPDPRIDAPSLSDELAAIVSRCLARDPADRFPNAGDLREALSRFLLGAGIERPGEELSAFFADPDGYRSRFVQGLVTRLLEQAERCIEGTERNPPRALAALNQVLALDPANARAKDLLDGMRRRHKRRRQLAVCAAAVGVVLLLAGVAAASHRFWVRNGQTTVAIADRASAPLAAVAHEPSTAPALEPQPREPRPSESATGSPPGSDAEPMTDTQASVHAAGDEAPGAAVPDRPVSKPLANPSKPHEIARPQEPRPTAPALKPGSRGGLIVKTALGSNQSPWGKIFVDGKWVNGQLPTFSGEVSAGDHRIRVEAPCCLPSEERQVTILPGEANVPVIVRLTPKPALLTVHSPEELQIWIGDFNAGTSKASETEPIPVPLPDGEVRGAVRLSFVRPGFKEQSRTEQFEAGKRKALTVELSKL